MSYKVNHFTYLRGGWAEDHRAAAVTLYPGKVHKSQLLQTDPRDALRHARHVAHKVGRSTVCNQHATVDVPLRNLSQPRIGDKVPEESTLFLRIPGFPYNNV